MFVFIVLHYMVIEETINCIENIKNNFLNENIRIIVVDNNSPNGSGKELQKQYAADDIVTVLLNPVNAGFAKGNNVGYKYALENFSPDFIIVINNDIQIKQKDFLQKIKKIYEKEKFAVLGPDIYSTTLNIHQSPKRLTSCSEEEIRQYISIYKKRCESKWATKIKCYLKRLRFLKRFVYKKRIKSNKIDFKKTYYNVPLHGSCFIFSKLFMDKRKNAFFEGTFMYYESEILDYECHRDGLKTMYSPQLQVFHNHNVSTNATFKSDIKRTMFMNECIYNSLTAFYGLIRNGQS